MTETLSNATNDPQLTIAELQRQLTECIAEREEATAQQVATAHVLKIISRTPVELQVVFKALLEAAARLCEAETGIIGLAKGKYYYFEATYGTSVEFNNFVSSHPAEINRGTGMGRALVDAKTVHITDVLADPEYKYFEGQRLGGFRALLSVPLLRHGTPIGVIGLGRRAVRPFTDKQIELVTTFADQAVIAIENVRLFNETNEALERQTASAEVLQVISSSPGDLKPVFDQMLAKAMSLCEAQCGFIYQMEQGAMRAVAEIGVPPALAEYRRNNLHTGGAATPADMMRATSKPAHVHDARDSEPYRNGNLNAVAGVDLGGARTVLYVPMIRNHDIVGVINVYRQEVRPFTEEQISLLENFASQAVIAIENTRLFNETQEALARQTATSDILRVISQSPTDVQPVFDAIVLSAVRLLACDSSFIQLCDGATFWPVAEAGPEGLRQPVTRRAPIDPEANFPSRAIIARKNLLIPDWSTIELPEHNRYIREQRGFNSAFYLPLLRNGECVGLLSFASKRANAFGDSEMSLAESFRDQALIAIENTRLFNETNDALERQTATADVLKVIASSPSDVQPVFDVIAASANRLMGGYSTTVWRHLDNMVHLAAYTPVNPTADEALRSVPPFSFSAAHYREQILEGSPVQFEDTENAIPRVAELARARGFRSLLIVPLMNKGRAIGSINVTRANVGSFAEADVQLLQTFADQAIIAIENSRLFDEVQARTGDLTEALQQQTATADVLQVISRSAFDLQSVLQTLAESAAQLSKTDMVNIWLRDGDVLRVQAHTGMTEAFHKFLQERPASPERGRFIGRAFLTGEIVHLPDVFDDPEYTFTGVPQMGGFRAVLGVPLVRDGRVEGVFGLARSTPGLFTAREIALVRTFADQAVIAIENARLFNETREALERQTTTADILKVIASSPSDVQPVFEAIAESAKRLLEGHSSLVTRVSGGMVHLAAFTEVDDAGRNVLQTAFPYALSDDRPHSNVAVTGIPLIFPDTETENYGWRAVARARGYRSLVVIPMLRDGITIGTIGVTRRDPGPFTDNAIALLKTFADQAVIAIENVRLFNETKEALERQTATAEILKVIASSPSDVQPVFEAVVNSAAILFEPCSATITTLKGGKLHWNASAQIVPSFDHEAARAVYPIPFNPDHSPSTRAILERRIIAIPDTNASDTPEYTRRISAAGGFRSITFVPLIHDNEGIGTIILTHPQTGFRFSDKQLALLQTFADQAVIAIQNARMFDEVQAKTRDLTESLQQQTATADVLKVISRSAFDLDSVLGTLVESATRVCEAERGMVYLRKSDQLHMSANFGFSAELEAFARSNPFPMDGGSTTARTAASGVPVQTVDILADETQGELALRYQQLGGHRCRLGVPLRRDGQTIGVFLLTRHEVRAFTDKQIEVVQTFADQAVIAIENVRLFDEVQARTKELSASLEELRTAQDRLVQTEKLASLGQLTAGIAHEIKNPLNFVNNFSALSAELTDELNDVLKPVVMDDKVRGDVDELTGLLKSNLEKVVEHGKRADSIVKNMLLHSREGSGEQRPADINALLDESLNLAYHGARAEKPEFNITLRRDLDPDAGAIDVFPQEITRAFINLISNGFYATSKRQVENRDPDFEPILSAATKNLGNHIEIRIRDNGTGIPAEVKEKIFNPFFTTKPAGEGTGLGLSMSHDIIVKQHGGRIEVDTQPGQFTEFTIVLPRTSNLANNRKN